MDGTNKTVLVVDDDEDFLDIAEEILRRADYEVITATSGEDGLEAAKRNSVDVVVCDINMPRMNGFEFINRLNRSSQSRVPVMLITAGTANVDFHCANFKADSFLLKQNLYDNLVPEVNAIVR